jgi:hypothetical protein
MPNTIQGLVYRLVKGSPLTAQEGDGNLSAIQAFVNALAAALGVSLNPDGTLVNGALNNPVQMANVPTFAALFEAALALLPSTFVANVYSVTTISQIVAYTAGMRVQFKAVATNTAPASLNVNGLGPQVIVKSANQPLVANDILINSVVEVIYDGTNFQLVGMTQVPATSTIAGPVQLAASTDVFTGTNTSLAVTPQSLGKQRFVSALFSLGTGASAQIANVVHLLTDASGNPVTPQWVRWVLVCTDAGGDVGYAQNDEVDVCGFADLSGNNTPAFGGGANKLNCFLSLYNSGGGGTNIPNKASGATGTIIYAKWSAKCYANAV